MISFLPIVGRELRVGARRRATFWTRLVFAGVAVLAVAAGLLIQLMQGGAGVGGGMFRTLSVLGFLACLFAGILLTADSLSSEKREGTLGLLFLTDLKGYDVVLGKLVATSLKAMHGVLAIFPVIAVTLIMGGVTGGEFWRMTLVFLCTMLLSLSLGMAMSSVSRQEQRAMIGTFLALGGLLVLPMAWGWVSGSSAVTWLSPLHCFMGAYDVRYRGDAAGFWWSLLMMPVLSCGCLAAASAVLPRSWQEGRGVNRRRAATRSALWQAGRESWRQRLLETNPVAWLAGRSERYRSGLWVACGLVVVVSLGAGGMALGGLDPMFLFVQGAVLSLLLRVMIGLDAGRFYVEARRTGSLELLLSTPIGARQIVSGPWHALRGRYLFPLLLLLGVEMGPWLWGRASGNETGFWVIGLGLFMNQGPVVLLSDVLAVGWLGMCLGLTLRQPGRAPLWTLFYAVLMPMLLFCVPRVLINVGLILWAREQVYRELGGRAGTGLRGPARGGGRRGGAS
jgi:ABC-type transport system involved in multi-copper enzyme maturation permease subunit